MPEAIPHQTDAFTGYAFADHAFSGSTSILMNPLNALMDPMVSRELKTDIETLKDMMHVMLAELHRSQEGPMMVDLGSEETRPGDMTAHFDPLMDQEIRLYTGRGDERMIIV